MKPLSIAVAVLATLVTVGGCKNRREEPVPGPKAFGPAAQAIAPSSDRPTGETQDTAARPDSAGRQHGASGISWFQGTLEEAFSTCSKCTAMFLRDALDR